MSKSHEEGSRSATFKEQHATFGSTFQSKTFGKMWIFTIEPNNLRTIFSTDFQNWGLQPLRLGIWESFLGKGILNSDGAFWKHSRALVRPMFWKEHVADLSSVDIHVARLLDLIPKDGSTVDLEPLFARFFLDVTTEFLFGESVECLTTDASMDANAFLEAFHYGQECIGKRLQLPQSNRSTKDKRFLDSCKIAREFVGKHVDGAILRCNSRGHENQRKYILTDELVREIKDKTEIENHLLHLFLAAHESTATLMTNVFFNLARKPDVYNRLRREILQQYSTEAISDDMSSLKYLQNVTETIRLNPVVGQSARIALRDTVLPTGGGVSATSPVYVRAGTPVQFNFHALHRRLEAYGHDAGIFHPERWDSLHVGQWDFMPFGGGPRVCPGQRMALMQVRYTTIRILQKFKEIENRDPVLEFVEQYRIIACSKNGAKVALIPA